MRPALVLKTEFSAAFPFQFRFQLLQSLFLDPGYIAAADTALLGDLPLGEGIFPRKTVAEGDDQLFPFIQVFLHTYPHRLSGILGGKVLQHVVVHPDHIHQGQGSGLPLCVQGVGEGDLPLEFPLGPEVH